jgi:SepF-like predicted cell division protein (DUF552 family)
MPAENRKRPVQLTIRVTKEEKALIYQKMALARMTNFQAYARQMATKGYIVDTDISELKNLAAEFQKITVNIRQTLKHVDTMGAAYAADAEEIRRKLDECWGMVRQLFKSAMRT